MRAPGPSEVLARSKRGPRITRLTHQHIPVSQSIMFEAKSRGFFASIHLSIYLSVCLPACLSVCLSVYPCYLHASMSICLSQYTQGPYQTMSHLCATVSKELGKNITTLPCASYGCHPSLWAACVAPCSPSSSSSSFVVCPWHVPWRQNSKCLQNPCLTRKNSVPETAHFQHMKESSKLIFLTPLHHSFNGQLYANYHLATSFRFSTLGAFK